MTNLRHIATEAGVSVDTVSRVLGGRNKEIWPGAIARGDRIRAIAERLGFRPNSAARAMRTRKSRQIGVLLRNAPDSRFDCMPAYETILGINERCEEAGYTVTLVRLGEVRDREPKAFREDMIDGLIALGGVPTSIEQRVQATAPACIWADGNVWREERCIRRDETQAGLLAAQSLADRGCRRLLYLPVPTLPPPHYSQAERYAGVTQLARSRGLPLSTLDAGPWPPHQPWRAAQWRELLSEPGLGVVAYDINHAEWLGFALAEAGLALGSDVRLASCDDRQATAGVWPGLCRSSFARFAFGREAADMLLGLLDHPEHPCPSRQVPPIFIEGTTAGPILPV